MSNHRRFTDDQLARTDLRIEAPGDYPGYTQAKPDPSLEPEILGSYDVSPAGGRLSNPGEPWFWCCHCQQLTHWHGFLITNETGAVYSLGSSCGPLHYGVDFPMAERRFRELEARKGVLQRLRSAAASQPAILESIDRLLEVRALR